MCNYSVVLFKTFVYPSLECSKKGTAISLRFFPPSETSKGLKFPIKIVKIFSFYLSIYIQLACIIVFSECLFHSSNRVDITCSIMRRQVIFSQLA